MTTRLPLIKQTLDEAWDEYQINDSREFPARSFELLFHAVKDIYLELERREIEGTQ